MKTRLYFLDNLRTFLIFIVILLHAGIVYEPILLDTWIVSDPSKSGSIGLIRMYLDVFVMFTLFFISGYFIPKSQKNNTDLDFIKSKFKRIMIPWIVAVSTLIPIYKIIFLYFRGLPQEEWYSYFHFFQRIGSDLSIFSNDLNQSWLWFLPILFLFQVLYFVLSKTKLISLNISLRTGVLLTLIIGVIYSMTISILGLKGWTLTTLLDFQNERLLVYFLVFLLGALCYKHRVFDANKRSKKYLIIFNILLMLGLGIYTIVALNLFFNMIDPARNYFFISENIDRIIYYTSQLISMLSFIYIFVDLFKFNINKSGRLWTVLNKNSYYVYIIHIVVLGIIALPLVNLAIPAFIKYLILTILIFIISNIIVSVSRKLF